MYTGGRYYSVQESGGEVYGIFNIPEGINLDPEDWIERLTPELEDILGNNGIQYSALVLGSPYGGPIRVEKIVIDIDPTVPDGLERAHTAVGLVALSSELFYQP